MQPHLVSTSDRKGPHPRQTLEEKPIVLKGVAVNPGVPSSNFAEPPPMLQARTASYRAVVIPAYNRQGGFHFAEKRDHSVYLPVLRQIGIKVQQIASDAHERVPVARTEEPAKPPLVAVKIGHVKDHGARWSRPYTQGAFLPIKSWLGASLRPHFSVARVPRHDKAGR